MPYVILSQRGDVMAAKQKYEVEMTDEQYMELNRVIASTSSKISAETKVRAKALKHLHDGLSPEDAGHKAKLHRQTVYDLRKKFCKDGFEATIYRKKREVPPVAPKVTGEVEAHIIATACSSPPSGKSSWTLSMIRDKVILDGVIDSIGKETVRLVLKKHNISLT